MFHNLEEFVKEYYGKPRDFTDNELVALMIGLYMSAYADGYNRGSNMLSPEQLFGYAGSPDYSNYCREWCNFICHSKTFESQKAEEIFIGATSQKSESFVQSVCDKWNAKLANGDVSINTARQGVLEDLGFDQKNDDVVNVRGWMDDIDVDTALVFKDLHFSNFSEPITKVETEERKDDTMFSTDKIEYQLLEAMHESLRKDVSEQATYQARTVCYGIEEAIEDLLNRMNDEDGDPTVTPDMYRKRIGKLMSIYASFSMDLMALGHRYDSWIDNIEEGKLD